jgi:hypothetical protein
MIATAITTEVAVMPEKDDTPFSKRRRRSDGDFDAVLVRRGKDRKRDLAPNADRTRRSELWHRFDAFEDFRAFRIHERGGIWAFKTAVQARNRKLKLTKLCLLCSSAPLRRKRTSRRLGFAAEGQRGREGRVGLDCMVGLR